MGYVYDARQMPKNISYTADKRYNDLIYGYLQTKSYKYEGVVDRYVPREEATATAIAEGLELSRPTVTKYISNLKEMGLMTKEVATNQYRLKVFEVEKGILISENTLQGLVNEKQRYLINIYIYLLNRYMANQYQEYTVLFNQIENYIGMSETSQKSNPRVKARLDRLRELKLIWYEERRDAQGRLRLIIKWINQCL